MLAAVGFFPEFLLIGRADRVAVFNHYCSVFAQLHRLALPHEAIMTMPPKRRTLFRGVWSGDFAGLDGDREAGGDRGNSQYSETNSAAHSAALVPRL